MNINAPFSLLNAEKGLLLSLTPPHSGRRVTVIRVQRFVGTINPSRSNAIEHEPKAGSPIYLFLEARTLDDNTHVLSVSDLLDLRREVLELIQLSTEGWRGLSVTVDIHAVLNHSSVVSLWDKAAL